MRTNFLLFGAIAALTGVALGAFGAHGLKTVLSPAMLETYKTGVSYQLWHALGLLIIALLQPPGQYSALLKWAGWLMTCGIVLFSGSLYCLALSNIKWLGMITPFGGLAFLGAWLLVTIFAIKQRGA